MARRNRSAPETENVVPLKGRKCPVCARPAVTRYRPFCSRRCADLDLGRWLKEDYRIATEEEMDNGDEPPEEG
jgi:endogenous inhibitor of DNA gyrase (YacG/DUF329 family)